MKRIAAVLVMAAGSVLAPIGGSTAQACSFDYVDSVKVVSKTYLGREKTYVTNTYKGPITINVEWAKSWTNSVSGSLELSKEAAAIGVAVETSVSVAKAEGASYNVPSGKYGRIYVSMPKWQVVNDITWNVCGKGGQYPQRVTRIYRSSKGNATYPGKFIAGESRTTYF